MGQCNYCTLVGIRARAQVQGQTVTLRPDGSGAGATHVHVHGPDEAPDDSNRKAWLMELPESCDC